jgi:phage shock protein A
METQISKAVEAEAKTLTSVKRAERSVQDLQGSLESMTSGAETALRNQKEDLAREAVESQLALESKLILAEATLETARESYAAAQSVRKDTQDQLQNIRAKKDEILTRARILQTQKAVQHNLAGPSVSTGSILDAVDAMEARLVEEEAALAVQKEGTSSTTSSSLERKIEDMNRSEEIERRMAALKESLSPKASHATA